MSRLLLVARLRRHQRRLPAARRRGVSTLPAHRQLRKARPAAASTVSRSRRIERLLAETPAEDLRKLFSAQELQRRRRRPRPRRQPGRALCRQGSLHQALPARGRARRRSVPSTFRWRAMATARRPSNSARRPQMALGRNRLRSISLSLTHDRTQASAVALAQAERAAPSRAARWLYRLLPFRRKVVLDNLRRVYGDAADDARDRAPGAGALRPPGPPAVGVPLVPVAAARARRSRWRGWRTSMRCSQRMRRARAC